MATLNKLMLVVAVLCLWFVGSETKCDSDSDCGYYGYCGDGSCICRFGHITEDCSVATSDSRRSAVIAMQIFLGLLYGLFSLLCAFGLYYSIAKTKSSSIVFISNVQKIIFGSMALSSFMECLYVSIDPLESWGPVVPPLANNMLWTQIFPAQIFCYSFLLFHWIELVNLSMDTMKKEYMLQKINMNYRGKEVTVEDMVEKVKTLNKLRKPFGIGVGAVTLTLLGSQFAKGAGKEPFIMNRVLFAVVVVCWVGLAFGFLFYGRRLVGIMPYQLAKRAKKLTFRLSVVSCFSAVAILVFVLVLTFIQTGNPDGDLGSWALAQVILWLINFSIVSVYLHWSKTWPFLAFSANISTKSNSQRNVEGTNSNSNSVGVQQNTSDMVSIDVEGEL